MDVLATVGITNIGAITQALAGSAVVGGLLCYELPNKVAGINARDVSFRSYAKGIGNVLVRCMPEVLGLTTLLCLAVLLRLRGDAGFVPVDAMEAAKWEKITAEWWFLMGADTLLNLQAMLRLLLLMFVAVRADKSGRSPLSGMASVFFLAAMLARGWVATQTLQYRLEGPLSLGGDMSVMCEAAMVPFLAAIGFKALKRFPAAAVAISLATCFSRCHYFNVAGSQAIDSVFTLAYILELFACFAYLTRTISMYCTEKVVKCDAIVGFMHFLMPAQQALAAFYWLTAFTPQEQLPIGAGRPWCLVIATNLLSFAALLCSMALYFGGNFVNGNSTHEAADAAAELEALDLEEHRAFP